MAGFVNIEDFLRMHMTPPTCRVRLERIQVDNIRQGEFAGVMCIGGEDLAKTTNTSPIQVNR